MKTHPREQADFGKELSEELNLARQQLSELRLQITGLERDNRLLSIMNDNADRLRRAHEAEQKLQYLYNDMLLAYCPSLIFLFDTDLHLQLATRSCLSILSADSLEDLKMCTPEDIFGGKMESAWIEKIIIQCRDVMLSREPRQYNDKIEFTDSTGYMNTQTDISPIIEEESGELRGVLLALINITELTLTKEHAEEAARSKSTFLANMSHEIRTPMNAIKGLAELVMMTEMSDLQRSYVSNIVSSSNSLLNIINDILDFSKIDANKIDIIKSEYSLSTILKDTCSVINLHAAEKDLSLIVDIDPALPDHLYGDDSRIKQVLLNILGNAVKYTAKGSVTFTVGYSKIDDSNIKLQFSVKDTGIGIKNEEIPNLFQAFSRADLRQNRSILGTGLGLAISKSLMQALGGDISVQSVYGQGSTFSFWLPQEVVNAAPLAAVKQADKKKILVIDDGTENSRLEPLFDRLGVQSVSLKRTRNQAIPGWENATHAIYYDGYDPVDLGKLRGSMPEAVFIVIRDVRRALEQPKFADISIYSPILVTDIVDALNNETINGLRRIPGTSDSLQSFKVREARALVVDDNALNLMVGSELLRSFGFEVEEVDSGESAIKICQEKYFDIIFMDHMMPGMDGIETTVYIRENPGLNCNTPIIALTANVVSGTKESFLICGMNDVVSKPIEVTELARSVIAWLPEDKILRAHVSDNAIPDKNSIKSSKFDLVGLLDDFGMYASDVIREIDGDLELFVKRLGHAEIVLGDMVTNLNELARLEDWAHFAHKIGDLKSLLHDIGARDCSMRAKKMEIAAHSDNISYIKHDFKSLMGNMYMLERKLEALIPLTQGKNSDGSYVPNDPLKVNLLLQGLLAAVQASDAAAATKCIDDVARNSFDHDLDMLLNDVRWALEEKDFEGAFNAANRAFNFFKK